MIISDAALLASGTAALEWCMLAKCPMVGPSHEASSTFYGETAGQNFGMANTEPAGRREIVPELLQDERRISAMHCCRCCSGVSRG